MTADPAALDRALARLSDLEFPPEVRFVSHAPMACEALVALGAEDRLDAWVKGMGTRLAPLAPPHLPAWDVEEDWPAHLGHAEDRPGWTGAFARAVDDEGWPAVVARWVPRLAPGLAAALFHGAIRTAHAVRAIDRADTPARRVELSRALGSWAVWCAPRPGRDAAPPGAPRRHDPQGDAVALAAQAARAYAEDPSIVVLHGVTGAMAVALLAPHLPPGAAAGLVDRLALEHAGLLAGRPPSVPLPDADWQERAVPAAAASGDPHQVKLVEACLRGHRATGDPAFALAAATVTGTPIT